MILTQFMPLSLNLNNNYQTQHVHCARSHTRMVRSLDTIPTKFSPLSLIIIIKPVFLVLGPILEWYDHLSKSPTVLEIYLCLY